MKNKTNPKEDILRQAIFKEHPIYFLILLFLSGSAILAEVYASIVFRNWVDLLTESSITSAVLAYGFLIPMMYATSWGLNAVFFKFDIDARYLVYKFAFTCLTAKSIEGTIDLLTRAKPGHIMQDIRNASESVGNIYNMLAFYGFRFVVILIAAIVLLGRIAWWAPVLVFIVSAISILVSYRQHTICVERSKAFVADQGVTSGNLVEVIDRVRIVKTFKQEARTLAQIEGDISQEGESKRSLRTSFLQLSVIQIVYKTSVIFLFLLVGVFSFSAGTIELGSLAMLITFSMTLSSVIEDLTTRLYELVSNYTKYRQVVENIERDKQDSEGIVTYEQGDQNRIEICDLTLRAGPETILENVNLRFPADKKVALLGPSGCGKTSLAECILGLRSHSGTVRFSTQFKNRRPKIVEVEQNPVHIGDTLHEWLTFGNRHAPVELIKNSIQSAALTDITNGQAMVPVLKQGLTLNGLSRGQKQRAAIARALIAEPDYIIFDEPTSALDETTSHMIMSRITQMGIGILVITHDMQHIGLFDEVYTFKNKSFENPPTPIYNCLASN